MVIDRNGTVRFTGLNQRGLKQAVEMLIAEPADPESGGTGSLPAGVNFPCSSESTATPAVAGGPWMQARLKYALAGKLPVAPAGSRRRIWILRRANFALAGKLPVAPAAAAGEPWMRREITWQQAA